MDGEMLSRVVGVLMCLCFLVSRHLLMEIFYQVVSTDVGQGFPAVMCFRESLPSDELLELIAPSSCTQNLLHFPFQLSID